MSRRWPVGSRDHVFTANDDRDSPPPKSTVCFSSRSSMEPVVPPEVTAELTQILSNLVLGDNDIRTRQLSFLSSQFLHSLISLFYSAENAVNDRLARTPELYLLALTQFAISADTEVVSTQQTFFHLIFPISLSLSDAFVLPSLTPPSPLPSCPGPTTKSWRTSSPTVSLRPPLF